MELLIEELKFTAASSSIDTTKQHKTLETLNAISGMLESLKYNRILEPINELDHRRDRSVGKNGGNKSNSGLIKQGQMSNSELKDKFDVRH